MSKTTVNAIGDLAVEVKRLEKRELLLSEIVNTLSLPQNWPHLHPNLKGIVLDWIQAWNDTASIYEVPPPPAQEQDEWR